MNAVLGSYRNGGYEVTIHDDGSKVRRQISDESPEFPESLDVKITNACDLGCLYCHESSVPSGKHATIAPLLKALEGLPAGVEIAIGGGNPLAHPGLAWLLLLLRERGLIANITVNGLHLFQDDYADLLRRLRAEQLVHGVGMTYDSAVMCNLQDLLDENTVVHFVAGVHDPQDVFTVPLRPRKVLILGYKSFGRGIAYAPKTERNLERWRYWIPSILSHPNNLTSFDNLALEQLRIRELVPTEIWERSYMGDDGTHTMYLDAVRREFAVSSTSPRTPLGELTIREAFCVVREMASQRP